MDWLKMYIFSIIKIKTKCYSINVKILWKTVEEE